MNKLLTLKDWAVSSMKYDFSEINVSCIGLHGVDGRNQGMLEELKEISKKWLVTLNSNFDFNDEEFATDLCTIENYIYNIDTKEQIDRYSRFGVAFVNITLLLNGLR